MALFDKVRRLLYWLASRPWKVLVLTFLAAAIITSISYYREYIYSYYKIRLDPETGLEVLAIVKDSVIPSGLGGGINNGVSFKRLDILHVFGPSRKGICLVGNTADTSSIKGWINNLQVCFWNTRILLTPQKEIESLECTAEGKVYRAMIRGAEEEDFESWMFLGVSTKFKDRPYILNSEMPALAEETKDHSSIRYATCPLTENDLKKFKKKVLVSRTELAGRIIAAEYLLKHLISIDNSKSGGLKRAIERKKRMQRNILKKQTSPMVAIPLELF